MARDLRKQSKRDNDKTAEYHRRQCGYLAFKFELLHSLLEATLKVVSSTPGFLRIETGIYFSGLFLKFEFLGAVIPVVDLFRQAVFDGGAGLFNPFETPAADLLQMLGNNVSDGVALSLLFQFARDPRTFGARENICDGWLLRLERSVIEIGCIL